MDDLALYPRLVRAQLRGQLQYRVSFLLDTTASFAGTFVQLLAIVIIFGAFPDLGGWRVGEVALLYGLVSVAFGLTELFGEGFERVANLVRTGNFDRLLIRPVSPFVQILASEMQLRRIGRIAQGLFALALAHRWLDLTWTAPKVGVLLLAIVSSAVVFQTVMVIGAAVCFWTVESSELQNIFTYGGIELATYPLHIYHRWLQRAFLYAVPLALTSYYPALYVLEKPDPLGLPTAVAYLAPLVAGGFFVVGQLAWRIGLRHYQSTGS